MQSAPLCVLCLSEFTGPVAYIAKLGAAARELVRFAHSCVETALMDPNACGLNHLGASWFATSV